ncbi:MAG: hypothetical protein ACAH04_09705, partial [Methylibium sp.]
AEDAAMRHDFRLVRTLIAALFVGFSSVSSAMELSGATADSGDRFPFEVKYQEKLICSNGAVPAHRGNGGPLRAAESAVSRRERFRKAQPGNGSLPESRFHCRPGARARIRALGSNAALVRRCRLH